MDALLFFVLLYLLAAFALYWIIRLAVRHGVQDVERDARTTRSSARVSETIRRQRATYGGAEEA